MWFTLILYRVCQNRLHLVHVCMHISCMVFFDVFCVCMYVCVYVSVFVSVCLFACFFSSFVGLFVWFGLVFGFVWLLVWFRLFIGLVCLFLWIACWLLGFVVASAVRDIAGGAIFPLSHEWDIWRNLSHGPGSSENLQLHVESEEFNFSMSPGWSVGLQFFASKITDTVSVLTRGVGEKFKKQWNIISTHAIVSFGFGNDLPLNQLPFATYLDIIYGCEMLCDYFSIN